MEFASAQVHKSGNSLHVTHGDDKGVYVTFSLEAIQHPYKSEQAGRPIWEDVPHVQILFPGDSTKKVFRPVDLVGTESKPSDPQRWPGQWAAFQSQSEQVQVGTPLLEWPPVGKSMALNLKAMSIHTVEQLSEVADHSLTWLGARELRDKARAWLAASTDGAAVMKLQKENDDLRADMEMLKAQFAEMNQSKPKGK
jgi:hypothetical protein